LIVWLLTVSPRPARRTFLRSQYALAARRPPSADTALLPTRVLLRLDATARLPHQQHARDVIAKRRVRARRWLRVLQVLLPVSAVSTAARTAATPASTTPTRDASALFASLLLRLQLDRAARLPHFADGRIVLVGQRRLRRRRRHTLLHLLLPPGSLGATGAAVRALRRRGRVRVLPGPRARLPVLADDHQTQVRA